MRRILVLLTVFLVLVLNYSCDEEEYHTKAKIGIENFTQYHLDSLILFSLPTLVQLVFKDIESNAFSGYKEYQDMDYTIYFRGYIGSQKLAATWILPIHNIDPSEPILSPYGTYTFGIIECDTVKEKMIIGLIEYYKFYK